MRRIIIVDIDGTIANNDHRRHILDELDDPYGDLEYADQDEIWDRFFSLMHKDILIKSVWNRIRKLKIQHDAQIIFLTARFEKHRKKTVTWLRKHLKLSKPIVLMRENGDRRPDYVIKKDIITMYFKPKHILCAFEDRDKNVKMMKKLGIKVFKV